MLAGKPVVASRDGGAAEIVEDMVTVASLGPEMRVSWRIRCASSWRPRLVASAWDSRVASAP
jgi:hypothetical protein